MEESSSQLPRKLRSESFEFDKFRGARICMVDSDSRRLCSSAWCGTGSSCGGFVRSKVSEGHDIFDIRL